MPPFVAKFISLPCRLQSVIQNLVSVEPKRDIVKDFDVIAQCCWFLFIKVALKISLIVHGLVLSLPVTKNSSTPIRDKKQAITLDRAEWRQRMEAFTFN